MKLCQATMKGDFNEVKRLVESGCDVNEKGSYRNHTFNESGTK